MFEKPASSEQTLTATTRTPRRRRVLSAATALSLSVPTALLLAGPAEAAVISSATYTGGGALVGGTYYAQSGKTLTLSATTTGDTRCITAGNGFSTSRGVQHAWTVTSLSAAKGTPDGPQSQTVLAGDDFNTDNKSGAVTGCKTKTTNKTVTYVLDDTAPALTGAPKGGSKAWYNDDVVIEWTATDAGSGLFASPEDSVIDGEGRGLSARRTVQDEVGNSTTAPYEGVNIDRHAPVTTATAPTSTDWNNVDQTILLTGRDPLSGVASTEYRINGGAWTRGNEVAFREDGVHTLTFRSTDHAGNVEADQKATVKIDKTRPTINHSQSPSANGNGWNKGPVTVTFDCADLGGSGIASCGVGSTAVNPVTVERDGKQQIVRGVAVDRAGNDVEDAASVSIDTVEPTITTTGVPQGWVNEDVTISFTYTDDLSGIASNDAATTTFGEGANQGITVSATDAAGNSRSETVTGVNVDKTAPSTTSDAPEGWQNGPVTVNLTAKDQAGLSGVASTEYSTDGGATWTTGAQVEFTADGRYALSFRSTDRAGNVEQAESVTVLIDTTAPAVTADEPTAQPTGTNGWYTSPVASTFTATDDGSGLVDAGQASFTASTGTAEGEGVTAASGAVSDVAGNTNPGVQSKAFKIDLTAPSAPTFSGIAAKEYTAASLPAQSSVGCTATDAVSGLAGCTVTGYGTSVGTHTLTATATDRAGRESTSTLTYTVAQDTWKLTGFLAPIGEANSFVRAPAESAPVAGSSTVWNTAKGGSTIPLKFKANHNGTDSTSTGDVKSFGSVKLPSCTGTTTDAVEELATAGSSSLRYDAAAGHFIQNWKTPTVTGDTCYRVTVTTQDGSSIHTFVRLRK
ncbi:hypothetical protein CLV92_101527 [Kineococcus xinjiangensis]|uniref:Ig-like domain-containing protein n=2 Tax=Kineococcus xinjiangensis TaxID=512762 RepID=A0A2S6IX17_9ACTN|nr:hypothetical protein CLV92_101527 [Kineococcus xinjiangensis]